MSRLATAALVVSFANLAHADAPATAQPPAGPSATAAERAAKPSPFDEIADVESREANLESKEPRKGVTVAGALGFGIMIGGDIGVGRGPAVSLRLGHVATRKTVITFEIAGTSALHKRTGVGPGAMESTTLTDSNFALLAGAQRYTTGSLWLRAAGGPTILVQNASTNGAGDKPIGGLGGLIGGGVDIARWGYLVFGAELFGMGSVSSDGLKLQLAFSLGLSYY